MLFLFIFMSLFTWVKFRQQRHQPFTASWWGYMAATGVAIAGATGVKMVGLFTVATVGLATVLDLWDLADYRRRYSNVPR
jgi:dolichyl-phosphate-mannose-protein mannosyltransferase